MSIEYKRVCSDTGSFIMEKIERRIVVYGIK